MSITAQEALNNVHQQWINEAMDKYPKELEALDKEIEKISIAGHRSVRIEDFLKENNFPVPDEYDLITLKRYFIAKGFETNENAGFIEGKYYKYSYISW
jgi:hypothetical protein